MFGLQVCPVCKREYDMPPFIKELFFNCDDCGKFTYTPQASIQLKNFPAGDPRLQPLINYIKERQQNDGPQITVDIMVNLGLFED